MHPANSQKHRNRNLLEDRSSAGSFSVSLVADVWYGWPTALVSKHEMPESVTLCEITFLQQSFELQQAMQRYRSMSRMLPLGQSKRFTSACSVADAMSRTFVGACSVRATLSTSTMPLQT